MLFPICTGIWVSIECSNQGADWIVKFSGNPLMAEIWSCMKACFTVESDKAAHGIVVRHLRFKYYLNHALVFVDPYIHAEYKIVSKGERCRHMRAVCLSAIVIGIINTTHLISSDSNNPDWNKFRYLVAIAIAIWGVLGCLVTFTKFIYVADMPLIWHIGNMAIIILNLAETDHTFGHDVKPSFFISEANVFVTIWAQV